MILSLVLCDRNLLILASIEDSEAAKRDGESLGGESSSSTFQGSPSSSTSSSHTFDETFGAGSVYFDTIASNLGVPSSDSNDEGAK